METDFLFALLGEGAAELPEGEEKPGYPAVEILRVGTFLDRKGLVVKVTREDLETFVRNFAEGTAQQEVPFDLEHERGKAAGWLRRLWVEGDRLLGQPEWNSLGVELIRERIYRYLSATIDLAKKVIRSVSLVNFPAVRGLAPLELAEGGRTFEIHEEEEEMPGEVDLEELRAQVRQEIEAEMEAQKKTITELRSQVREEVAAELEATYARRAELQAYADELCGGEAGLSAKPEDVVAFLEGLNDAQLEQAQTLLQAKVVDFQERGSEADDKREHGEKNALPEEYARALDAGELSLADLNDPILNLGDLGQYDLSKWDK